MPGLLVSLFERRSHPSAPESWMLRAFGIPEDASGIQVDEDTALKFSAVWACVRILSETVGSLPLHVYRKLGRGKERAYDHPVYRLLHDQPNSQMSSMTMLETCQAHLSLWGNAYIEVEKNNADQVIGLWPLLPDRTYARRREGIKEIVTRPDRVQDEVLRPDRREVVHVPGLGFNGIRGYSPIAYQRQAIGLGLAAQEFGAKFFGSGARPDGVLEFDGAFKDDAERQAFRERWELVHQGPERARRTAILEAGMKWNQVTIPPDDAQFLETREFQVRDIARIFRIPPHLVGDLERATFSNIEHQGIEFVVHTIRPWLVRWEQALNQILFSPQEQGRYYAKFLVAGLLRGDIQTRYEAYAKGRQNGWLSANDILELEDMNPIPGGDTYWMPLNMQPINGRGPSADGRALRGTEPEDWDPDGSTEIRTARSLAARRRETEAHRPLIEAAAQRIVRREAEAVRRAARAQLAERDVGGFQTWMGTWYKSHREYVLRQMEPVLQAMAPAIYAAALEEVGEDSQPDPTVFVREYSETYALRHVGSSEGQLDKLLEETPAEEQQAAILERMDAWEETRPGKIGQRESVRAGSAFAIAAWVVVGVTRKIWRANADACPLCKSLDGRVVGIEKHFVSAGDTVSAEGSEPLTAGTNVGGPQLHDGCECSVSAG